MTFKKDEIIFLIGAGASKDADIPTSIDMVLEIEEFLAKKDEWRKYKDLYHYIKSAILYADGILGAFHNSLNIERLVNTLRELERKEKHTIYPFIGNWNMKLIELAEVNFSKIHSFRKQIIDQLHRWILIKDYRVAGYYRKLVDFHGVYNFPLRVFSLNYDLCIERNCKDANIERGFTSDKQWDWRRFDADLEEADIFLYKLHGSIDWQRDENDTLTYTDEPAASEHVDVIFGTDYKLQYIDPYLFYAYQFRQYALDAKLIVAIGYGFGDEHINSMLGQALRKDHAKRLVAIMPAADDKDIRTRVKDAVQPPSEDQVHVKNMTAKEFLEGHLTIEELEGLFPEDESVPF